ncbi:hypothetical protein [Microbacterium sp.]|jgi:hypothetical protein|uniref:hypothetical protein n=1 Tax=Microbacterium sp. TaxID=51671 RepID=UPI0037C72ECF
MHSSPFDTTIDSVAGYLHRRRRSGVPLTAGEAATLAIAVVRGCADAPSRAVGAQWRLTAEGRPVLCEDPRGPDVLTVTAAVLDDLVSLVDADVRPGFARLHDGVLTDPPPVWARLERRLLAVVDPRPLVLGPLTPVVPEAPSTQREDPLDAQGAPRIDRLRTLARRLRPRVVLTGVGVAAVVATAALSIAPPSAAPDANGETLPARSRSTPAASSSETPSVAAPATHASDGAKPDGVAAQRADAESTSSPPARTPSPDDVAAAVAAVLTAVATCDDDACASALRESPAEPDEPRPLDPATSDLAMIDDLGGLVVVRLTAGDHAQYVTLVRDEDRWLVRSVRDVADQPS